MLRLTRSLRFRFFIIVWPLVVAITVGVGWYFGRWARVEVTRTFNSVAESSVMPAALGDRVGEAVRTSGDIGSLEDALGRIASEFADDEGPPLVAVAGGERLAVSEALPDEASVAIDDEGRLLYRALSERGGRQAEIVTAAAGFPIDPGPSVWHTFYVLPRAGLRDGSPEGPLDGGEERTMETDVAGFIDAADRAITAAVILSSVIAAIATFLLAQPLVGQAGRLAAAARRIREGDLGARVESPSNDELGDVARAFNDMASELEKSEALRTRLISDVSHELRTPLTNLVGGFEALEDKLMAPDEKTLESLHQEALVLQRLVQDLQEVAVAEAGGLSLDLEPIDLRQAVDQAVASLAAQASRQRIAFRVANAAAGQPPAFEVEADRRRVSQILRNLLQNAASHAPEGTDVRVTLEGDAEAVTVSVVDRGPGVAPEHQPLVWNRFHRIDPARSRERGGVGLGLAIVKSLVEAHGGRVGLSSEPGRGATFWFRLPRRAVR